MEQYLTYRLSELSLKGEKAFIETEDTKKYSHVFTGYAIVWDGEPDYNGFTISRASVGESLTRWTESDNVLPVLYNHNQDNPFFNIGHVISATVDDKGLLVTCAIDVEGNKIATQVWKLLKARRVKEMSFFGIIQDSTVGDYGEEHITKLEIKEVSVVFFAANKSALVETIKQSVNQLKALDATEELELVVSHVSECVDCDTSNTDSDTDCDTSNTDSDTDTIDTKSDIINKTAVSATKADTAKQQAKINNIIRKYLK